MFDRVPYRNQKALSIEGFHKEVIGTCAHGLHRHIDRPMRRDNHNLARQVAAADFLEDIQAIHVR